ncbi:MAG TPA: ribonuclease P protein component [Mollicutes bacterium]|nr:ribonuclease P protein component [Mollicutes bacterium]
MKKINIIRKSKEFAKMIKNRHYYSNRFFIIYIMKKSEKYFRFGISIPKKVGKSVIRNKIKRQIKSIIDNNKKFNRDLDYVIIVRKEILNLKYKEMAESLNLLLSKIDGECKK